MRADFVPHVTAAELNAGTSAKRLVSRSAKCLLVLEALLGLLIFDLLRLGHNFARLYGYVTRWPLCSRTNGSVSEICKSVNYAAVCYPKRLRCLQRSAVMTCLLRHHGIAARMVIGIQSVPFRSHAWTEVNSKAINERRDVQRIYQVIESC
jgi:hypothetical protein